MGNTNKLSLTLEDFNSDEHSPAGVKDFFKPIEKAMDVTDFNETYAKTHLVFDANQVRRMLIDSIEKGGLSESPTKASNIQTVLVKGVTGDKVNVFVIERKGVDFDSFEKAMKKNNPRLAMRRITDKNGHHRIVYVRVGEDSKETDFETGDKVSYEHNGKKYTGEIKSLKFNDKTDKIGTAIIETSDGQKHSKSLKAITPAAKQYNDGVAKEVAKNNVKDAVDAKKEAAMDNSEFDHYMTQINDKQIDFIVHDFLLKKPTQKHKASMYNEALKELSNGQNGKWNKLRPSERIALRGKVKGFAKNHIKNAGPHGPKTIETNFTKPEKNAPSKTEKSLKYLKDLLNEKDAKIEIKKNSGNDDRIVYVNGLTAFNLDDAHGMSSDEDRKTAMSRAYKASKNAKGVLETISFDKYDDMRKVMRPLLTKYGADVVDTGDNIFVATGAGIPSGMKTKITQGKIDTGEFLGKGGHIINEEDFGEDEAIDAYKEVFKELGYKLKEDKLSEGTDTWGFELVKNTPKKKQSKKIKKAFDTLFNK